MTSQDVEHRLKALQEAIEAQPNESICEAVTAALTEVVSAEIVDVDLLTQHREIAIHLDSCLSCSDAYARLVELAVTGEALPEPPSIPAPDLRFLASAETSLQDTLAAALRRTAEGISLRLSDQLLQWFPPPATPAVAVRGSEQRYATILHQIPASADDALPFTLTVFADAEQPQSCLVEMQVGLPHRAWPELGGIEVAISAEGLHRTAPTDAWGLASFADVARGELPTLTVQISMETS